MNIDTKILNKIQQSEYKNTLKGPYWIMIKWDLSQICKIFQYLQKQCDTPHQQIK